MTGSCEHLPRSFSRKRTVGEALATLISPNEHFPAVMVDVMDVSRGGVGVLVPAEVPLGVGEQVLLLLPVKPCGHREFRMEVRWLKDGELFVSAGMAFV